MDGPIVADVFYEYLFRNGRDSTPDTTEAAYALHLAAKLRYPIPALGSFHTYENIISRYMHTENVESELLFSHSYWDVYVYNFTHYEISRTSEDRGYVREEILTRRWMKSRKVIEIGRRRFLTLHNEFR